MPFVSHVVRRKKYSNTLKSSAFVASSIKLSQKVFAVLYLPQKKKPDGVKRRSHNLPNYSHMLLKGEIL